MVNMHRTGTRFLCLFLGTATLLAGTLAAAPPAQARGRGPRSMALQGLLADLSRLEVLNVEHESDSIEQTIQQQIDAARRQLLGAVSGAVPLTLALRTTQRSLRAISGLVNDGNYFEDEELLPQLNGLLERMRVRTEQMLAVVAQNGPAYVPPPPPYDPAPPPPPYGPAQPPYVVAPPPPAAPQPLTQDRLDVLVGRVRDAAFRDAQLNMLRDALQAGAYFTCQQAIQLMQATAFGDLQAEIGGMLYPRVVDPQNFNDVIASLTFETHRQKLRRMIGR